MSSDHGADAGNPPDITRGESLPLLTEDDAPLFRIDREGTWHYRGSPIRRTRLVKLFAGVLRREGDSHWLVTPVERARVIVDDAPFIATGATWEDGPDGPEIHVTTNLDETVLLDRDHPLRTEIDPETQEPRPYVMVRDGLEALVARSVFYDLADQATERTVDGTPVMGLVSAGSFFVLGPVEEEATA